MPFPKKPFDTYLLIVKGNFDQVNGALSRYGVDALVVGDEKIGRIVCKAQGIGTVLLPILQKWEAETILPDANGSKVYGSLLQYKKIL